MDVIAPWIDWIHATASAHSCATITIASVLVAVCCFFALSYLFKPKPLFQAVDMNHQSRVLPGPERIHRTAIPGVTELLGTYYDGVETMYDNFMRGAATAGDKPSFGTSKGSGLPFNWLTYSEVVERATHLGSGMASMGIPVGQKSFVGLFSINKLEWVLGDLACQFYSRVSVPLYSTLDEETIAYVVNHCGISAVVSDACVLNNLVDAAAKCKGLKLVVVIGDKVDEATAKRLAELGVRSATIAEVEAEGKEKPIKHHPPKADDIFTVCPTSGTTGMPKGVVLTHRNVIANMSALLHVAVPSIDGGVTPNDVHLSYLPLAHMFERVVMALVVSGGAQVTFFRGNVRKLLDDIADVRPTFFASVPRLYNRIYDAVMGKVKDGGCLKQAVFKIALSMKESEVKQGVARNNSIWDRIAFKAIQAKLGGRVRLAITAAAPLSSEVMRFLKCCLGCPVVEAYGQTETSPAVSLTLCGDSSRGHVGAVLPCCEIKLVDVPDMKYFAANDEGEICFRGLNITQGYFKDPKLTAEAFDKEGWLHSGDVGRWLPNGALKIIDRKKSMFKLSQGEYVAPEKVEQVYAESVPVMQVFVYGNSVRRSLVGVVVPDAAVLKKWLKKTLSHVDLSCSVEELCEKDEVRQAILLDMKRIGKLRELKGFEQVQIIHLHCDPFSEENGLLTPTQKSKRPQLTELFKDEIERMYETLGENRSLD